jgi:hypothetical protein
MDAGIQTVFEMSDEGKPSKLDNGEERQILH